MKTMIERLFLVVLSSQFFLQSLPAQKPAATIPAFQFARIDGGQFSNKELRKDRFPFFFFFDPTCSHCQEAAANLDKHIRDYSNTAFYLVSTDTREAITRFTRLYMPNLLKSTGATILVDTKQVFISSFQPLRYPAMFLYNLKQELVDYEDNAASMFRFINIIKKLTQQAGS